VVGEELQIKNIKLESVRELVQTLVHNVQELDKNGRETGLIVHGVVIPARESVAHRQPFALDQHTESLQGTVVGVED